MSGRFLLVGDAHVVVEELADCRRLADLIVRALEEAGNPDLILLGDLYNNHAVIRVEVIAFWNQFFARLADRGTMVYALVGNHDRPQSGAQGDIHSLMAHDGHQRRVIISKPWRPASGSWTAPYAFMPHMPTPEAWVEAFDQLGRPPLVFCHQTFAGCRYENGFFAPDGVSTAVLGDSKVISGHIHTPQQVGNVWYPGAPRWRSIADANVDRFLYLIEVGGHHADYRVIQTWATDQVCTPIRLKTITSTSELEELQNAPGLRVTVQGGESFVKEAEASLRSKGIRFRSQVVGTENHIGQIRESDGISTAFKRFWDSFDPPAKTPKVDLERLVSTRLSW